MRLIGELDDQNQAKTFVAYLHTLGVTTQIDQAGDLWEVWVKEEDFLETATTELDAYRNNPNDPKYAAAVAKSEAIRREEEAKRRQIQKNIVKVSAGPKQRKFPLTVLLMVICGIVALLTDFGEEKTIGTVSRALSFLSLESTEAGKAMLAADEDPDSITLRTASISQGEAWRAITPMFLHFGPTHILFNMFWLFYLGRMIEDRYGTFWFAMIVLFTSAAANFAQGLVPMGIGGTPPGYVPELELLITRFGGMSGVVYGLFGFAWMKMLFDRSSRITVTQMDIFIMVAWLFFCMTPQSTEWFGLNVANWAHGMGVVSGMLIGYLTSLRS